MKIQILPQDRSLFPAWSSLLFQDVLKKQVIATLSRIPDGHIVLQDGQELHSFGDPNSELHARIEVLDARFYTLVALQGSVGGGEAFIREYWKCAELTTLVRILTRNRKVLTSMESGLAALSAPVMNFFHWLKRNTLEGSRRNIEAHYDLGNDFFGLFLDPTMMYSCAIFDKTTPDLESASKLKLERICSKLNLGRDDHILEIGTGWGSFAIYAATTRGCRVTTTTISPSQHAYAQERIRSLGLENQITLLQKDYRELEGHYDKLVSIEMIEAVGHQFYGDFFKTCSSLLKPEGTMLLQAITIVDQYFSEASRSVDFIKTFVFPGSCIPSIMAIGQATAENSDLRMIHLEDITEHYPPTLRAWLDSIKSNRDKILALGYPEQILRLWEYYLCYCEGGFLERHIGDVQMILAKPGWKGSAPLGSFA